MAEIDREPDMRLEMMSQPRFLAAARAMTINFAERIGFAESVCSQISLAVDEALCNVINHGYSRTPDGRIWIDLWSIDGEKRPGIRIVIQDRAKQVDPAAIKSRNLDEIRPGGLGVHIIREVMDEAMYEKRDGGGMRLTMVKRAAADSADGAKDTTCTGASCASGENAH